MRTTFHRLLHLPPRPARCVPWMSLLALGMLCMPSGPVAAQERGLQARLGAGAGVGLRSVELPTVEGPRAIDTGLFPALDLGLDSQLRLGESLFMTVGARYRTSLGLTGTETPFGGALRETPLRAHRAELTLGPMWALSSSPQHVRLGLQAGAELRAVGTVLALTIPDYTLFGPLMRATLDIPLGGDALRLTLAPELVAWLWATGTLRRLGALERGGLALGGEVALQLRLSEAFALDLTYRGSRGRIGSGLDGDFVDLEHFVTLRGVFVY